MHLAYSSLNPADQQSAKNKTAPNNTLLVRYQAYQATCNKFAREITAIQKYLPGWTPAFKY